MIARAHALAIWSERFALGAWLQRRSSCAEIGAFAIRMGVPTLDRFFDQIAPLGRDLSPGCQSLEKCLGDIFLAIGSNSNQAKVTVRRARYGRG
jgi:hypothetical protein